MQACGLNSLVVYFNVNAHDIWEGNVIIRSDISFENIFSLGFQDEREGVTLRRLVLRSLECKSIISFKWMLVVFKPNVCIRPLSSSWVLKWVANDLYEPFTKLFNLVAKGGSPASWTMNIIQMICKRNYRTIMLGTILGKIYSSILEEKISWWAYLKGEKAGGQPTFREGRYTLDHILTLCTLLEQEIFASRCLYSCFVDSKMAFDTIPHGKLLEYLQRLRVPPHLQQAKKTIVVYSRILRKSSFKRWHTHWSNVQHWC